MTPATIDDDLQDGPISRRLIASHWANALLSLLAAALAQANPACANGSSAFFCLRPDAQRA
jgi:hypothetical protein